MKSTSINDPKRRARFCISAVLFSGILMLGLNFLLSAFAAVPLILLFGEEIFNNELVMVLFEIVVYLLILFLTGGFLLIIFHKSPVSAFRGPLSTPNYPFLFIPAAIGMFYLLNLVVGIVFQKPLEPFETVIDETAYPGTPLGVALYCIMICVLPAIFEEWLFRGIMQKNLASAVGRMPALVISALVFGLMHSHPSQSVFAFAFGLVVGYAFDRTGSIWFGSLIHILNNAVSFLSTYWYYVYHVETVELILGVFILIMIGTFIAAIPVYIVSAVRSKRKLVRKTVAERALPTGGTVLKMTLCNPLLYILFACYCIMLWLLYFVLV